jgi:hypothetical protein
VAKHKVKVKLVAECEVELEVEVSESEPDGDPTDLTAMEQDAACRKGDPWPQWEVESVRLA